MHFVDGDDGDLGGRLKSIKAAVVEQVARKEVTEMNRSSIDTSCSTTFVS